MKTLAFIALISMVYFILAVAALHFLRPDINPIKQATGYYATGPHRLLMTSAFFCIGLASLTLVIGLYKSMSPPARSPLGFVLLGIWIVGVVIAMYFPLNPEGTRVTILAHIHRMSTPISFLCLTLGAIVVSRSFKLDENWYPIYGSTVMLSWLMLAMFVASFVVAITRSGFLGLTQRVSLAAFAIWLLIVAVRLLTITGGR